MLVALTVGDERGVGHTTTDDRVGVLVGVSVGRQLDGTESTEQEVAATRARIEAVEKLLERYSRKDN